ncbi:hypothetical protein HDU67_006728 [Dinochytrium kinnereticum]|nr:hypothetical protein HDU67_006728 [Dinochytrium kinnereticum]
MSVSRHLVEGIHLQMGSFAPLELPVGRGRSTNVERFRQKFGATGAITYDGDSWLGDRWGKAPDSVSQGASMGRGVMASPILGVGGGSGGGRMSLTNHGGSNRSSVTASGRFSQAIARQSLHQQQDTSGNALPSLQFPMQAKGHGIHVGRRPRSGAGHRGSGSRELGDDDAEPDWNSVPSSKGKSNRVGRKGGKGGAAGARSGLSREYLPDNHDQSMGNNGSGSNGTLHGHEEHQDHLHHDDHDERASKASRSSRNGSIVQLGAKRRSSDNLEGEGASKRNSYYRGHEPDHHRASVASQNGDRVRSNNHHDESESHRGAHRNSRYDNKSSHHGTHESVYQNSYSHSNVDLSSTSISEHHHRYHRSSKATHDSPDHSISSLQHSLEDFGTHRSADTVHESKNGHHQHHDTRAHRSNGEIYEAVEGGSMESVGSSQPSYMDVSVGLTPSQAVELHRLGQKVKMAMALVAMKNLERTMDENVVRDALFLREADEELEGLSNAKKAYEEHLISCDVPRDSKLFKDMMLAVDSDIDPNKVAPIPLHRSSKSRHEYTDKELGILEKRRSTQDPDRLKGMFNWRESDNPAHVYSRGVTMIDIDSELAMPRPPELEGGLLKKPVEEVLSVEQEGGGDIDDYMEPAVDAPPEEEPAPRPTQSAGKRRIARKPLLPPLPRPPPTRAQRQHFIPQKQSLDQRILSPQVFDTSGLLLSDSHAPSHAAMRNAMSWLHKSTRRRMPPSSVFFLINPHLELMVDGKPPKLDGELESLATTPAAGTVVGGGGGRFMGSRMTTPFPLQNGNEQPEVNEEEGKQVDDRGRDKDRYRQVRGRSKSVDPSLSNKRVNGSEGVELSRSSKEVNDVNHVEVSRFNGSDPPADSFCMSKRSTTNQSDLSRPNPKPSHDATKRSLASTPGPSSYNPYRIPQNHKSRSRPSSPPKSEVHFVDPNTRILQAPFTGKKFSVHTYDMTERTFMNAPEGVFLSPSSSMPRLPKIHSRQLSGSVPSDDEDSEWEENDKVRGRAASAGSLRRGMDERDGDNPNLRRHKRHVTDPTRLDDDEEPTMSWRDGNPDGALLNDRWERDRGVSSSLRDLKLVGKRAVISPVPLGDFGKKKGAASGDGLRRGDGRGKGDGGGEQKLLEVDMGGLPHPIF